MAKRYNLATDPVLKRDSFVCPYSSCSVLTTQYWYTILASLVNYNNELISPRIDGDVLMVAICHSCKNASLWRGENLIYPAVESNAPPPNKDLPPEVTKIYREAASIMQKSPRATVALLRLAIETLCIELKCEGENLQGKINSLVEKDSGLQEVVEAMDIVRLVGNAGVHAGIIQISENSDIVADMFILINFAAEQLLTAPKKRADIINRAKQLREESKNKESE